ncbi:hypothetical protein GQ55_9G061400 [Panicum hallii var. hallii]|uniref:Uncharacterized protein n=1 Tax=Panicum hallii var. hallii TaxID=1504633 RepID=A0A2T7C094_9POAL|nr:hypothetical protein GQ55_9G061400 [Panicum hallii var. hallii]
MGDRIWITDSRIRTGRGPLILEEDLADKELELADSNGAATARNFLVSFFHCISTLLIRRLLQSLLTNDDPFRNIQGLITSSHQPHSMFCLLYPSTKCNALKI